MFGILARNLPSHLCRTHDQSPFLSAFAQTISESAAASVLTSKGRLTLSSESKVAHWLVLTDEGRYRADSRAPQSKRGQRQHI
eukprot:6205982-Pleurochrysis_carterae.AAC.2